VREAHARGWSATLDGRPVPLAVFRRTAPLGALPRGKSTLRLRYRMPLLVLGAALSAAAALACAWHSQDPMSVRVVSAGLDLPESRLRELSARLDERERGAEPSAFVLERHRRRFRRRVGCCGRRWPRSSRSIPARWRFEYAPHAEPRLAAAHGGELSFNPRIPRTGC
jgi:hypothetical protein